MAKPRPILIAAASVCFLQACATVPGPTTSRAMKMEPLLKIQNSGSQTAATYYRLGKYHHERGNKDEARAALVQSIGLDRRQVEARNALAVLDSEEGRLEDAKSMLMQLVRDHPRLAYLHNNLAYVHLLRGEPDAAIPSLERALALEPGNKRALNNLGLVQTSLVEKRDRLTAALGLAGVIVEKVSGVADTPQHQATVSANAGEAAAANAVAVARQATLIGPGVEAPKLPSFEVQSPTSRMEVIQILTNVIELRQRQPAAPVMVERRQEKAEKPENKFEPKTLMATPPQTRPFRFDVANGNGIPGMALRMREALTRRDLKVTRVINKRPFNTPSTEIQYVAGFEKEAERVRAAMASHVTMKPVSALSGTQEVRLVLGKDAAGYAALMGEAQLLVMNEKQAR